MRRAFIVDPMCIINYGHNAVLLHHYKKFTEMYYDSVSMHVCNHYDTRASELIKSFRYHYNDKINVLSEEDDFIQYKDEIENENSSVFYKIQAATNDFTNIINKYAVSSDDVIIFPGADYYGILGVLAAIKDRGYKNSPKLKFRFIGVMEYLGHMHQSLKVIKNKVLEASLNGVFISIAAETRSYASYLSNEFDKYIDTVPYPQTYSYKKNIIVEPFRIFCPGSARTDKGFLDLYTIIKNVLNKRGLNIEFIFQSLRPEEMLIHKSYVNKLYALPNIRMLPHAISDNEMINYYEQSNLILLPYDKLTYKYRGSAALMEGTSVGRPVITLKGCAFSTEVLFYNLGWVEDDINQISDRIIDISNKSSDELDNSFKIHLNQFIQDSNELNKKWICK